MHSVRDPPDEREERNKKKIESAKAISSHANSNASASASVVGAGSLPPLQEHHDDASVMMDQVKPTVNGAETIFSSARVGKN
jgi:hypothetical protein